MYIIRPPPMSTRLAKDSARAVVASEQASAIRASNFTTMCLMVVRFSLSIHLLSARLFRLQSRLSDHPFGGHALVANEAREFLQSDPRRLDRTIDVHSLPEVAIIDDAGNLICEVGDDRLRRPGRCEQGEPGLGVIYAAAVYRQGW